MLQSVKGDTRLSGPEEFGEAEWTARVELAALYRSMVKFGMTDFINNHITLRVPGEPEHFLINSYGMLYEEVTASSFFKVDHEGAVVYDPENGFGCNPAGFAIHGALHRARADVNCVIHTHTRAGVAVSCMPEGLLPMSQQACALGKIAYHHYEGPIVTAEACDQLIEDVGDANCVIMHNHGLAVAAGSVAEAFFLNYMLENACKIQVDVMAATRAPVLPPDEIIKYTADFASGHHEGRARWWAAMLRSLEPQRESYSR